MKNQHIVELEVDDWIAETDKAYLVVINGVKVWLPKSQCEFDENDAIMSMPESLAIDRELI